MTQPQTKIYKLKTGRIRCEIDEGVEIELVMRRLATPEKIRYAPLMGRAGEDLSAWAHALEPYAAYEEECAALADGAPVPEAPTSPLHDLDPDLWASVADAITSVVASATVYQDEAPYEVGPRDRAELIGQLSTPDLLRALTCAVRSEDLTEHEKNS